MRRRSLAAFGFVLAAGAGATLVTLAPAETEAAVGTQTFVIPASDGYGIADCVATGSSCGQVVADSWCEAQGFARSSSYGLAEVTPASTGASRPISVTCSE